MSRETLLRAAFVGIRNFSVPVNEDFSEVIRFLNVDWSGSTFAADIRSSPATTGSPLDSMTVTSPTYSDGNTIITVSLPDAEVLALAATVSGGDLMEEAVLYWDLLRVTGAVTKVVLSGTFTLVPGVTAA